MLGVGGNERGFADRCEHHESRRDRGAVTESYEVMEPPGLNRPLPGGRSSRGGTTRDFLRPVRIARDTFVAVEIFGKVDYETAAEQALQPEITQLPEFSALGKNPADGLIAFRTIVTIDDASQSVSVVASSGQPADRDGLFLAGSLPGADRPAPRNVGRDVMGLFALFTPLLSAVAPTSPLDGDIAPLAISATVSALPFALAGFELLKVERVIFYGAELAVRERLAGPEISLLFRNRDGHTRAPARRQAADCVHHGIPSRHQPAG